MNFLRRERTRSGKRMKNRTDFALYLKNRINSYQARLDEEEFEDEEEAVHLTQHIQRLLKIIEELAPAPEAERRTA